MSEKRFRIIGEAVFMIPAALILYLKYGWQSVVVLALVDLAHYIRWHADLD